DGRFGMLETIREFGLDRLTESGDLTAAHAAHAAYFLQLAETAEPHFVAPDQLLWLDRIEHEHDNVRAALRWLLDNGPADEAPRLAGALWRFWLAHGHLGEGRQWLDAALAQGGPPSLRVNALIGAGFLAHYQADYR